MNNENELHDVTFKIRYPSKKEKIIYAVKSILIDELTILAESIAIAAILCSFFSNEWSIPQKYNVFIVVSFQAKCKKVRYYRYFPLGRVTLN